MEASDRRIGIRVDLELFLTEYIRDRPFRVLSSNLSETGLYIHRVTPDPEISLVPPGTAVGIELELPGTGEVIWARGEVCRETWGRRRSAPVRPRRQGLVPMPAPGPLASSPSPASLRPSAVVCGAGVRFADMPRVHARMVRDFCHERRQARLDQLLDRIRRTPPSYVPRPARPRSSGTLRRRILAESGTLGARQVA